MTVRLLADLKSRLSNTRHGNNAQDERDLLASAYSWAYQTQPGLAPPQSPNAADIEFRDFANGSSGVTDAGLTWANQSTSTEVINQGRLILTSPVATTMRALLKAPPGAGNFTVTTAVDFVTRIFPQWMGLALVWGTAATPTAVRGVGAYNSGGISLRANWTTYNTSWAATTDVATVDNPAGYSDLLFVRVAWDGTNLVQSVSPSGINGTFVQITSQALGLGRPSLVGVAVNEGGSGVAVRSPFHFLRFDWTADYDPTTP